MSQPYVGQIFMFAGNFAPAGWMACNGQIIPISENDVLFQLIGTTYGGDGESTFALPNLQGRIPIHMGQGAGLSSYQIGQTGGAESVTLTTQQIPSHNHMAQTSTVGGTSASPQSGSILADEVTQGAPSGGNAYAYVAGNTAPLAPLPGNTVVNAGGNQPHENMQPFGVVLYCISLFGIFPTPN
jgi:microcystin-dependent protein